MLHQSLGNAQHAKRFAADVTISVANVDKDGKYAPIQTLSNQSDSRAPDKYSGLTRNHGQKRKVGQTPTGKPHPGDANLPE